MTRPQRKGRSEPEDVVVSTVDFTDKPPVRVRYDWVAIARRLQNRPMEWALIFEEDRTSLVNALRQGGITALRREYGFELRTANNTRGQPRMCTLWMRYDPEQDGRL